MNSSNHYWDDISNLLKVEEHHRHSQWVNQFLNLLNQGFVTIIDPEPIQGPDHWPYLHMRIERHATEPSTKVFSWLNERGIGALIDHQENQKIPDLVMSWGMIWWYLKHRQLYLKDQLPEHEKVDFHWGEVRQWGGPHPDYLPDSARRILREFFFQQQIMNPRILVYSLDGQNYHLAFSLESLGNPESQEHQGILEALSWFLPPHYSICLVSELGGPKFETL